MKGKILFGLGLGVGYLLGSRAGREHYEKVKAQAKNAWESPAVQEKVSAAEAKIGDTVREQGANVAEKITDTVKSTFSSGSDSGSSVGAEDVQAPAEPYPPAPNS